MKLKKILPARLYVLLLNLKLSWSYFFNGYPFRKYTDKNRCIFIHIPKNAGTSILSSLMGGGLKRDHASYYDFRRVSSYKFEHYFKFCFVRNPYDRAVSCYEYLKNGGDGKDDLYFKDLFNNKYSTFDSFVLNYLDANRIHEHVLFKPQYLFVYNHKEELQVDFLGRYENINNDFYFICNRLNISCELPKKNRVKRKSFEGYYNNDLVRKKVFELYVKDFSLFGYDENIQ